MGPRGADVGARTARQRRAGLIRGRATGRPDDAAPGEHPVARPLRGRSGGRADGVHREPAVRPAAGGRRHHRLAGPRARARAGRRAEHRRGRRGARGPRPGRASSWSTDDVRVRAVRRGHPHRGRASGHRAGRPGRGQAPHRPQPQRPGGHRPAAVHQARGRWPSPAGCSCSSRCCSSWPRPPATPTCRATPICSGPSRCCWPITCWPTAGRSPATSIGCSTPGAASTCRRSAPARWPARRSPLDPEGVAADLGFAAAFDNSLDAVSDRDFVAEALFDLALLGIHLSRLGEEVVLWSTEEFGFLKLADALLDRQLDAPAEEEPRHRRAGPGQVGSADRPPDRPAGHAQGPAARLQPRPAGGQGAAVRRARPGHAGAGGAWPACSRRRRSSSRPCRRRPTARRPRPPTWPSTSSPPACRSATPTPWSAPWSASRSTAACRSPTWSSAHEALGPDAVPLLDAAARRSAAHHRGGAGPRPWPTSSSASASRLAADRSSGRGRALSGRGRRHGPPPRDPGPLRRGRPPAGGLQRPLPGLRRRRHGPLDARARRRLRVARAGTSCSSGPSSTGTARPAWAT